MWTMLVSSDFLVIVIIAVDLFFPGTDLPTEDVLGPTPFFKAA